MNGYLARDVSHFSLSLGIHSFYVSEHTKPINEVLMVLTLRHGECSDYLYHYFYKITNKINGRVYYGIHSTNKLDDGYMGSGTALLVDYKKYGKRNFTKDIIKFFGTREEASNYERLIVDENVVKSAMYYNLQLGGDYGDPSEMIIARNLETGDIFKCSRSDINNSCGKIVPARNGLICVCRVDSDKIELISTEEYHKNPMLYRTMRSGSVTVIDNETGEYAVVKCNDSRIKDGKFRYLWSGRKHTKETIEKVRKTFGKIHHQQGEKNSHYGTHWMTNGNENICVKCDECERYAKMGWTYGRHIPLNKRGPSPAQDLLDVRIVQKRLNDGMTLKHICIEFGVSLSVLKKFVKKHKIVNPRSPSCRNKTNE